ncbi:MAG: hypothetical protein NVSMB42_15680 [Herpetosiphon sp.]
MQDPNERRIVQEEIVRTPLGAEATVVEQRMSVAPTPAEQALGTSLRVQQIVWFVVGVLLALIALRFLLLAFGANMTTGFGAFLYNVTQPFVAPFLSLFNEQGRALGQGSVVEAGALVALAVYALVGWLIAKLVSIVMTPRTTVL